VCSIPPQLALRKRWPPYLRDQGLTDKVFWATKVNVAAGGGKAK